MPGDIDQECCAIEVCCGDPEDGGAKQRQAVARIIGKAVGHRPLTLASVADAVCDTFDLAEKGTLKAFKDSIAKFARSGPYA